MAPAQHFRSAFNGFNREDVVNYIEQLNNQYNAQIQQLNNQLREAKSASSRSVIQDLQVQLDSALLRCAKLEEQLNSRQQEVKNSVSSAVADRLQEQLNAALLRCTALEEQLKHRDASTLTKELEAYRRAEEAERKAHERARVICAQAQSALDDATAMAESAVESFSQIAGRTHQQLKEYQDAVAATVDGFRAAAASMNAEKSE